MNSRWGWYTPSRLAAAAALSALLLANLAARASATPFDHDEIVTLVITGLPSFASIWAAHLDGLDLTPPLNSFITHVSRALFGSGLVTARLPEIVGFWVTSLVVFELVRGRANVRTGGVAVLLLHFTSASTFAIQARGYGLMLALFALALFFWSEAAAGRRRAVYLPLLTVTIAAGFWIHYYSIFVLVPLMAGEIARLARRRRPDTPMWLAMGLASLALVPLAPLLAVGLDHASTFWSRPFIGDVPALYAFLLGRLTRMAFIVLAAAVVAFIAAGFWSGESRLQFGSSIPAYEVAAGIGSVAIPVIAIAVAMASVGAFASRYAITATVGIAIVGALVTWRGVTGTLFLRVWYAATTEQRANLFYLSDSEAAVRFSGSDTIDRGYQSLRRWMPIAILDYQSHVARREPFSVYTQGEFEWLPQQLARDGARVVHQSNEGASGLYRVSWDAW